jgi:hypothetical protein
MGGTEPFQQVKSWHSRTKARAASLMTRRSNSFLGTSAFPLVATREEVPPITTSHRPAGVVGGRAWRGRWVRVGGRVGNTALRLSEANGRTMGNRTQHLEAAYVRRSRRPSRCLKHARSRFRLLLSNRLTDWVVSSMVCCGPICEPAVTDGRRGSGPGSGVRRRGSGPGSGIGVGCRVPWVERRGRALGSGVTGWVLGQALVRGRRAVSPNAARGPAGNPFRSEARKMVPYVRNDMKP